MQSTKTPTRRRTRRDEYDETWARVMREDFGLRRWLLSWHPLDDGRGWLARLSCPEWPETVEAEGRSRCLAIARAQRSLGLLLAASRAAGERWREV